MVRDRFIQQQIVSTGVWRRVSSVITSDNLLEETISILIVFNYISIYICLGFLFRVGFVSGFISYSLQISFWTVKCKVKVFVTEKPNRRRNEEELGQYR